MTRDAAQVVLDEKSFPEEAPVELDHDSVAALVSFFQLLDKWEREADYDAKVMRKPC